MQELLAQNSGHETGHELLIPQIEMPDVNQEVREAQDLLQSYMGITVKDEATHDMAVSIIKKARDYMGKVDEKFAPIKEPLNAAIKSLNGLIKELKEPAETLCAELRKDCLAWKKAEEQRVREEQARLLEAARKDWTPLDDDIPTQVSARPSASASGVRKSPWKARITNLDELWEAAIRDPRYREYFIPDEKALNAKARSMGTMMNIPGVEAYQEQTLVIR